MKLKNKKGFTLLELLAVVLIIAILAAISVPLYQRMILKSRSAEVNNLLTLVRTRQAQNFAKERKYATSFENTILSQITTDANSEVNNNTFKTVNSDYQLQLIDDGEHRCVIGRYISPDTVDAQTADFAFAISYDMSGLGCSDNETQAGQGNPDTYQYTKKMCAYFGDIVGSVSDVCQGIVMEGMDVHVGQCCHGYQYWDIKTSSCKTIPGINLGNHYIEGTGDSCLQCAYQEDDNHQPVLRVVDGTTGYPLTPQHHQRIFSCTDPQAAIVESQVDENGYYQCNSAHYEVWDDNACDWVCPDPDVVGDICPEDQVFNRNTCTCMCKFGEQCGCDPTQKPVDQTQVAAPEHEHCECIASLEEVRWIADDQPCQCRARAEFGESEGERALVNPFKHCSCASGRSPVFYGTITDASSLNDVNNHYAAQYQHETTSIHQYADQEEFAHKAACCADKDVWAAADLPGNFGHSACCPYTDTYKKEGTVLPDLHIAFNVSSTECCAETVPFYNHEENTTLTDPNTQYSLKPFGPVAAGTCHKCAVLTDAYDATYGCYACPGKTFSIWNAGLGVATCKCPTGTEPTGDITTVDSEDCTCTKDNTHWDYDVHYENEATVRTNWHQINGACKCNDGYTDTYWGLQLDTEGNGSNAVSDLAGFCCPTQEGGLNYTTASHVSGELACCPYNMEYKRDGAEQDPVHAQFNTTDHACCGVETPFYNLTASNSVMDPNFSTRPIVRQLNNDTYSTDSNDVDSIPANLCHKCEKLTDAYDDTYGCFTCKGRTFTLWNSENGVSSCHCPTGTTGTPSTPWDAASTESDCQCIKANAEWNDSIAYQYGANDGLVANNAWHKNNGACKCKSGYTDVVWGVQMEIDESAEVDSTNGFCCPSGFATNVYNESNNLVSGQKACCPTDKVFFHQTTYASNTCGVCQNQYDTYVGGHCQPCPENMVPVWNAELGYSVCQCPIGSQVAAGKQDGIATDDDTICECKLAYATWKAPEGWINKYVNKFILNEEDTSMPGTWDTVNGYCSCDENYDLARYGEINNPYVPTDNTPNAGALVASPASAAGTGYCCPRTPQNQWWQTVGLTPVRDFCCDASVDFNNEAARSHCCPSNQPHFFDLSTVKDAEYTINGVPGKLGEVGRSNLGDTEEQNRLTRGACSACEFPYLNADCEECPFPKVPVWNNGDVAGENGYSTCECPKGTANEKPSWWESFLSWFGYTPDEPGCYCDIPGTVWHDTVDDNGYHCQCEGENVLTQSRQDGTHACCPQGTNIAGEGTSGSYYNTHYCCPEGKAYYYGGEGEDGCHICPQDRPYFWFTEAPEGSNNADTTEEIPTYLSDEDVAQFCHACPRNRPYQLGTNGICCPNNISNASGQVVYGIDVPGVGFRCTLCENCHPGGGGLTCTTGDSGIVPNLVWDETAASYVCQCPNGSPYSEEYGCLCQTGCGDYVGQSSFTQQYLGYDVVSCSGCGARRVWNPENCCENNDVSCCVCNESSGYYSTNYSSASYIEQNESCNYSVSASRYLNGCCAAADIVDAGNGKTACCGSGIDFNRSKGSCCSANAPHYTSSYSSNMNYPVCYKCQPGEYLVGNTCTVCGSNPNNSYIDPISQLGGWSDCKGAYTQCGCKVGSLSGAGDKISYKNTIPGSTYYNLGQSNCRCPNEGEHYYTTDGYFSGATYLGYESNEGKACQTCPIGTASSYAHRGWRNGVNYGYGCACDTTQHLDILPQDGKCVCASGYYLMDSDYKRCDEYNGTTCLCRACPTPETTAIANSTVGNPGCECAAGYTLKQYNTTQQCDGFNGSSCICGDCPQGMHIISGTTNCTCNTGSLMTDLFVACDSYNPQNACTCRTCPTGMIPNGAGGCTCDTNNGYYLLDANYQRCNTYDGSNCICRACPSGTSWYDASTYPTARCARCPADQVWNPNESSCQTCSQHDPLEDQVNTNSWNATYMAYTQCDCMQGYGEQTNPVYEIPGSRCSCPATQRGQYWAVGTNPVTHITSYAPSTANVRFENNMLIGGQCMNCQAPSTFDAHLFVAGTTAPCKCGDNEYYDTATGTCKCVNGYYRMNPTTLTYDENGTCMNCSVEEHMHLEGSGTNVYCACDAGYHVMDENYNTGLTERAYVYRPNMKCRSCNSLAGNWVYASPNFVQQISGGCKCPTGNHAYFYTGNNALTHCTPGQGNCYCGTCPAYTDWCTNSNSDGQCQCDKHKYKDPVSNHEYWLGTSVHVTEVPSAEYDEYLPYQQTVTLPNNGGTRYCKYTCNGISTSVTGDEDTPRSTLICAVCTSGSGKPDDQLGTCLSNSICSRNSTHCTCINPLN